METNQTDINKIKMYEQYFNVSIQKFESLNRRFISIAIIDLRLIGLLLMAIGFIAKVKNSMIPKSQRELLSSNEFISILIIGAVLLILGSYFRVKVIQENRKAIDEAAKNSKGILERWEMGIINYASH